MKLGRIILENVLPEDDISLLFLKLLGGERIGASQSTTSDLCWWDRRVQTAEMFEQVVNFNVQGYTMRNHLVPVLIYWKKENL